MRRAHREGTDRADGASDRALWQRCRLADAEADEGERFLDLAGFAEGRLDADDSARVAAFLEADPVLGEDVAACAALAASGEPPAPPEAIVARACALVAGTAPARPNAAPQSTAATLAETRPRSVVRFVPRARARPQIAGLARWGSLAAAIALASWVGFAMGSNASLAFSDLNQPDQGFINELFDPSNGFLRDLTDGSQT